MIQRRSRSVLQASQLSSSDVPLSVIYGAHVCFFMLSERGLHPSGTVRHDSCNLTPELLIACDHLGAPR